MNPKDTRSTTAAVAAPDLDGGSAANPSTPGPVGSETARLDDDGAPTWPPGQPADADIRLVWGAGPNPPDGTWWPRTLDAPAEIAAVLLQMSEHVGGPVNRVSLNIDAWDDNQPPLMNLDGRRVRLGWFHTLDPSTITFGRSSDPRVTLRVVPPAPAHEQIDEAAGRRV